MVLHILVYNEWSCGVQLWYGLYYFILVLNIIMEVFAFRGNIHVLWVLFAFRGYYPHFVDLYVLRGYYPHFVEISMFRRYYPCFVKISTSRGYYPHFVHIKYIYHITSYLSRNIHPIFHIYSFSESDWCITSFHFVT